MSYSHEPSQRQRRPSSERAATDSSPPARAHTWRPAAATTVRKVCAYVTRDARELLVFRGPGHDGLQVPKGTIERNEPPRQALQRELKEESGLRPGTAPTHITTDIWTRRNHPPRRYLRHFYHVSVDEPRDNWTHTVTGSGAERGYEFEFAWVPLDDSTPPEESAEFALGLDDYVPILRERL